MDGRKINLNVDKYITPQAVEAIVGDGMPKMITSEDPLNTHLKSHSQLAKGNLYVKFDIVFPNDLTSEKKKQILSILAENQASVAAEMEDQ